MNTTTKIPVEIPRDVLRALDALLDYTAYDEMRHYAGEDDHIWLAIRRLLEWRAGLPGISIHRSRDLLNQATKLAEEIA